MTEINNLILGIDVGIKNFAVCMITPEKVIKYWKVFDTGIDYNDGKLKVSKKIIDTISLIPVHYDRVFVEAQPGKNRKMDYIEVVVITHFLTKGIPVEPIRSNLKFGSLMGIKCPAGKVNYDLRKEMSVSYVETVISGPCKENFFDRQSKKDDLADAYCICVLGLL